MRTPRTLYIYIRNGENVSDLILFKISWHSLYEVAVQHKPYSESIHSLSGVEHCITVVDPETLAEPDIKEFMKTREFISAQKNPFEPHPMNLISRVMMESFRRWAQEQEPFDVVVLGQTTFSEKIMRIQPFKARPSIFVRFSSYYGDGPGGTRPSPRELGFHIDCPKDLKMLFELLNCDGFVRALSLGSRDNAYASVKELNETKIFRKKPLILF